jgi:single-strand DNA-binding protein
MASHYLCSGNLTNDAVLRDVGNSKVLNFSVAVNVGYGEKKEAHFVDCAIWGKRGESLAQSLVKATAVIVGGELKLDKFAKKDGSQGMALRMNVDSFDFQPADYGRCIRSEYCQHKSEHRQYERRLS